jgi:hypothetical protein
MGKITPEDLEADLDQMPDCLHKYKVILEKFKAGGNEKFTDG